MCERAHFISLCSLPGTGLELVAREVELQGYRVAVLQDWALDRARYSPEWSRSQFRRVSSPGPSLHMHAIIASDNL